MALDLTLVFTAALLASVHCAGMCGGFALLAAGPDPTRALRRQAAYATGKTLTYALLGAVAGLAGAVLSAPFTGMQRLLSVAAGLLMIFVGLGQLGLVRRLEGLGVIARSPLFRRLLSAAASYRSPGATFTLGMVNGLLPCGLVYAFIAQAAAAGTPLKGAMVMGVFGLATLPALAGVALAGHLLRPALRTRLFRVGAVAVILLGLLTGLRGLPSPLHDAPPSGPHSAHRHATLP